MVKAKINWQKNIFGIKLNMVIAAICYNTSWKSWAVYRLCNSTVPFKKKIKQALKQGRTLFLKVQSEQQKIADRHKELQFSK